MGSTEIWLRNGVFTDKPEEVILRYYVEMRSGTRAYDETALPTDDEFPREQLEMARKLANKLGGRGIPDKAIAILCARESMIVQRLTEVPFTITILDEIDSIPWDSITELFNAFRVPYVTIARYTKMLHKKRPNLIPILDSRVRDDYFMPTINRGALVGLSDGAMATYLMREMRKDVSQNSSELIRLHNWKGKPYAISILRIFDILVWCRFGPFWERFADLYTRIH